MPRTPAENEKIRAAARQAIIDSALTLFGRNGYAHTSIRQIAREAGIATGLMYHYFDNKEALLVAVLDSCIGVINETVGEIMVSYAPPQRLPMLMDGLFAILAEKKELWQLFNMLRNQPAIMAVLGDELRRHTAVLRTCFIEDLRAIGRENAQIEGYVLYSLLEGTIQQFLLQPDDYPLEEVKKEIKKYTRYEIRITNYETQDLEDEQ
ncbi:MAG: TetR/AcrR family transcriptional regulator [Ardenticatenaceae bacterium]|nr:TetR/AcrR family transcriptional regulator [Ardenticatenaceae bacterium]